MAEMHIGKLALKLTGLDEFQAKRLAEKMAAGLQHQPLEDGLPERAEVVRVRLNAAPGATADWLAEHAISELIRELKRS